jgi:hypothetical protein
MRFLLFLGLAAAQLLGPWCRSGDLYYACRPDGSPTWVPLAITSTTFNADYDMIYMHNVNEQ